MGILEVDSQADRACEEVEEDGSQWGRGRRAADTIGAIHQEAVRVLTCILLSCRPQAVDQGAMVIMIGTKWCELSSFFLQLPRTASR